MNNLSQKIMISAIRHKKAFPLFSPVDFELTARTNQEALTLAANMMALGYIPSDQMIRCFQYASSIDAIAPLAEDIICSLQNLKGADQPYNPMYPNFPKQVMEMNEVHLWFNAIVHYISGGTWLPLFEKEHRGYVLEDKEYIVVDVMDHDGLIELFNQLVTSKDSISQADMDFIEALMVSGYVGDLGLPEEIPFAEIRAKVVATCLRNKMPQPVDDYIKTTTDILRVATALSDGDVSLAENTKFRSFPRGLRRWLVDHLEIVIKEEDIARHKNKWVKLAHALHVGDYSKKVYDIIKKARENKRIETFNGQIEEGMKSPNAELVMKLATRPSELARRMDKILREGDKETIQTAISAFNAAAPQIPTRILMQLGGHFHSRDKDRQRMIFPKGLSQKAFMLKKHEKKVDPWSITMMIGAIRYAMAERFSKEEHMGKVWIDQDLIKCPVPQQMRSSSEGTMTVARGTHLPFGDWNTIRMFIQWIGQDVDLSAEFYDTHFNHKGHISYTNLRDGFACHSGDITRAPAPKGAAEFIDIDIEKALAQDVRYVLMSVHDYSNQGFDNYDHCYMGWMGRDFPQSNEIFDPSTVQHKIDVRTPTRTAAPAMFDLKERKVIWLDVSQPRDHGINNVENHAASLQETVMGMSDLHEAKFTLYDLFVAHAQVRGDIVTDKDEADITFGFGDCDVTPFDVATINSEYIK